MDKRTVIETTLNMINVLRDYFIADEYGDDEIDDGVDADWQIEQIDKAHEIIETLLPEVRVAENEVEKITQSSVAQESLTSVINGLFQCIEAENEEKSQVLIDELYRLYEEYGDDYYQTSMHLEMMRLADLPAKPFLMKHSDITNWDKFYIESIYNGLFSHWLRCMIETLEGSACSGDKEGFVTRCVVKSIVEQTNISLYKTYGNYGDKYNDGKTDINRQTYWSPLSFKDTDEVKKKFKQWWRVIEEKQEGKFDERTEKKPFPRKQRLI